MHLPRYNYYAGESKTIFEFVSIGPKGSIKKLVEYTLVIPEIYNLGFGDLDESKEETYDDLVTSNNGDSGKILATVAATVYEFTENHPKAAILASGSTKSRTRLYRMGINRYLCEIQEQFTVFGYCQSNFWETFSKEEDYDAFLLTRSENYEQLWQELQVLNQMVKTER